MRLFRQKYPIYAKYRRLFPPYLLIREDLLQFRVMNVVYFDVNYPFCCHFEVVLINNQDNLNEVDTISSATVTSEALKKLLDNIMND